MIRGVTFDWWHTIAESTPEFDDEMRRIRVRGVREALAVAGVRADAEALEDAYDRHTEYLVARWRRLEDPSPDEQVREFLRLARLGVPEDAVAGPVARAFGGAIRDRPPSLYPHVAEVLALLEGRGLRIGLVSNTGRTWGRYLRALQDDLGIGPLFDVRVFSDEVGRRKPERTIFEAALGPLGLRPQEVVHVGDDLDADIAGAKRLGMRAVWFSAEPWANPDAAAADASIRDHAELPDLLETWSR
jgi:putative hydrolase of the HAD superfamily